MASCGLGETPWPLTFSGPVGCGKTSAALLMFDWTADADLFNPNEFLTLERLADDVTEAMFDRLFNTLHRDWPKISTAEFWRRWNRKTLCGIDDLGEKENVTDHRYQVLKRAIDEREGKPLIITTNLSLGDVSRLYDDRVASRLAGGTLVQCRGDDMRIS